MLTPAYFNPRSPHGERLYLRLPNGEVKISTHAPRTGSDEITAVLFCFTSISTHAPRTGSDRVIPLMPNKGFTFQPTLPARGATCYTPTAIQSTAFQPTLPARGATA